MKWGDTVRLQCKLSTLMGMKRMTIKEVHEKTKLSRTTISNLYSDKATRIDFETIAKLCDLFQCEVNELLCIEENKKIK